MPFATASSEFLYKTRPLEKCIFEVLQYLIIPGQNSLSSGAAGFARKTNNMYER